MATGFNVTGRTWSRADGKSVALPAMAATVDSLASVGPAGAMAGGLSLRCGAVAVSAAGVPHVLYSRYAEGAPGELFLACPDARGRWSRQSLAPAIAAKWPGWGLKMAGGLTFGAGGRLLLVATLFRREPGDTRKLWGHPSNEVVWMASADGGKTFRASPVSRPDAERPTGHNPAGRPGVIFTSGPAGKSNRDVLANEVYWVRPGGAVTSR